MQEKELIQKVKFKTFTDRTNFFLALYHTTHVQY
jgi:hypothetical protein